MEPQTLTRPMKLKFYTPLLYAPAKIDIPLILNEVSKVVDIPVDEFLTKSRKREYVLARQISMALACKFTKKSQSVIGEMIGGKDHATTIHACKTIDNLLFAKDPEVMNVYLPVFKKLELIKTGDSFVIEDDIADSIFNTEK